MSKIKTREKTKDIKVLDRSAIIGQRMKSAFIRSKKNAEALIDDRQATRIGTPRSEAEGQSQSASAFHSISA